MNAFFNLFFFLVSFYGLYYLSYLFLKKFLNTEFIHKNNFFCFFLAHFFTLGTIGLFSSVGYYFDLSNNKIRYTLFFIALIGQTLAINSQVYSLNNFSKFFSHLFRAVRGFSKLEKFYLTVIIVFLLNYFYRSLIPWFDQDEISQYGQFTKLISNGWTFSSLFSALRDGNMKFAESLYSQMYFVFNSTLFARFFKFINLISLLGLTYSFLLLIRTARSQAILACALILGTPELGYLATSMKVDGTTMVFEWCAFLLLLLSSFLKPKNFLYFVGLSCTFAYMATATRPSGIYSSMILTTIFVYYLFKNLTKNNFKNNFYVSLFVLLTALFYAHPYLVHIYHLGNPLFPFKSPWPFENGQYQLTINNWRGFCNIPQFLPFPLYQIYLIFHVGLGFETSLFSWAKFIPHAADKGVSIGQLSPCLLAIFLAPFYWKKDKFIKHSSFLFIPLFIAWTVGVQLTRVLLATAQLPILMSVRMGPRVIKLLNVALVFLLAYQTLYTFIKYPHSLFTLISKESRYESNRRVLEGYNGPITHYFGLNEHEHGLNLPRIHLSYEDVSLLNKAISKIPFGKILVLNILSYGLHIYFTHGLFIQGQLSKEKGFVIESKNMKLSDFNCLLLPIELESEAQIPRYMFSKVMLRSSKFELLCQASYDKKHAI